MAQLFASGNVTFLRVEGETVTAGYEFDADESETEEIARGEMIEILEAWRDAIIAAGGAHGPESMPPDAPPIVV